MYTAQHSWRSIGVFGDQIRGDEGSPGVFGWTIVIVTDLLHYLGLWGLSRRSNSYHNETVILFWPPVEFSDQKRRIAIKLVHANDDVAWPLTS